MSDTVEHLKAENAALTTALAVARAKLRLMTERRMSEPAAHRWLQREAMARGQRLAVVAAEVLGS
jgi:response regulator NasT